MARKKDSQVTKQDLMDAALKNFYQIGFENTSLDKISRDAHVSRGAAYWHFANKTELFYQLVLQILEKVQAEKQIIMEDDALSFKEKVVKVIFVPYNNSMNFKFLQQSLKTIEQHQEFEELLQEIRESKRRLYQFFLEGLTAEGLSKADAEALASLFYNYFEGMYGSATPQEVKDNYTLETIRKNVSFIFNMI
ncbi:TetR/AcrR family transcriptional regulator [Enterococcus sp. 669A]|uniref:TetR/AcrR family transcriptional regulator n=1 Tax=Candidatus Enterococcus moelleringii TaxID=2815325 RepID=A0ABS3LGT3_9ENTE|nr:TetR/AcrR family transcriptional regulator [Enterococcus sp. 669A]MBO1308847.1 TetR/AcrR family transcriptional regulator [Enterococcus sp. 669A]